MIEIRLVRNIWFYDPNRQLGPEGGFGIVYYGEDEKGNPYAIKKLKVDAIQAGHRELGFAKDFIGRDFSNIIQVFDAGQDSESDDYFIVMALAEKSLQDELTQRNSLSDSQVKEILLSIVNGLLEVPEIVHRDLKPGNILFHSNRWKIADFGIAKFVEEATSTNTLKYCFSYPYTAPEQWKFDHSTKKTDVYALGCIGYALLTGSLPFKGPNREDYKKQHLQIDPSPIDNRNGLLCSLLIFMLRKNQEVRPSFERIKNQLESMEIKDNSLSENDVINNLQRIGKIDAERKSREEAELQKKEYLKRQRLAIAEEGWGILVGILERLFSNIKENVPTVILSNISSINLRQLSSAELGRASLNVNYLIEKGLAYENQFIKSGWDVLAGATISVSQEVPQNGWGASLWYMRRNKIDEYRWCEVGYMADPFKRRKPEFEPYALTDIAAADLTAANGISTYKHAYGPMPFDDENMQLFIETWLKRFSQAYDGKLQRPYRLPL